MPTERETFSQFLKDLDSNRVSASVCIKKLHLQYSKMAQKQGYIKQHGGIWIVTTKEDDFIRQLEGDFT